MQNNRWDIVVRVLHWLQVVAVATCLLTGLINSELLEHALFNVHMVSGVVVLLLIIVRGWWGVVGSENARFINFIPRLKRIKDYLNGVDMVGHKPPAALAVITMLTLLSVQAISGLLSVEEDSEFYAPLSQWVTEDMQLRFTGWHLFNSQIVMAVIALHIAVIVTKQFVLKQKIINKIVFNAVVTKEESNEQKNEKI